MRTRTPLTSFLCPLLLHPPSPPFQCPVHHCRPPTISTRHHPPPSTVLDEPFYPSHHSLPSPPLLHSAPPLCSFPHCPVVLPTDVHARSLHDHGSGKVTKLVLHRTCPPGRMVGVLVRHACPFATVQGQILIVFVQQHGLTVHGSTGHASIPIHA